jgi:hypothetical protein
LGKISAVTARRFGLYLAVALLLGLAGYGLTLWALFGCAPPPLPGDELWTWRQYAGEALGLVLRLGSKDCFTLDPAAATALAAGTRTLGVLLVALALMVLWETAGRALRRRWYALRGGHVVLAGVFDDVAGLARRHHHRMGTFYLAPDRGAASEIARQRPFAEIAVLLPRRLAPQLHGLGAPLARLLAATTTSDLSNVALAEAGLALPGRGEIIVRLEQHAVRTLSSHRLRWRAAEQNRPLAVVSLTQLQTRRGLVAAMPGRYLLDGAPRVHIALCGSGPGLPAASLEIVRQGYGLEREPPLLTILRTGATDFAAGTLHRLQTAGVAQVEVTDVSAELLDRAIGTMVDEAPPLLAVHCLGADGEAEALALKWEEALLALRQPIPPIVCYAHGPAPLGRTGMIRAAAADDLAAAREAAQLMDARARAVHQQFLDAQRAARGAAFGTLPAEVEWARLPETYQDDNRAVADQIDYKLASVLLLAEPGAGALRLDADEVEVLSGIAHARWMAARGLAGWRYGPERDERRLLHPDMVPYAELTEAARQKDRDEVLTLPALAALAGETLKRERRIGLPRPLEPEAYEAFLGALRATPKDQVPVLVLPLDDADLVELAGRLVTIGLRVAVLLDGWSAGLRGNETLAASLAGVLRQAWRISIVRESEARRALGEEVSEIVDETGAINALE